MQFTAASNDAIIHAATYSLKVVASLPDGTVNLVPALVNIIIAPALITAPSTPVAPSSAITY